VAKRGGDFPPGTLETAQVAIADWLEVEPDAFDVELP
jgi:hypothetical protein